MSCPSLPPTPYTVLLSPSQDMWFSGCFLWLRVGVSPCPAVTYSTCAPSVAEPALWCHRWGTQHFYWADFLGSPCSGWSQQHRRGGEGREHWRTLRKKVSDGLFGQLLQNCILQFSPTLLTSLLQWILLLQVRLPRTWVCQQGVLTILSLFPLQDISSTEARMEQYLLICKLPLFQTAGKEKTTSRRQSQLGKERGKQASKAQWDDPCLPFWAKQVPGMHMACFQWLWEPEACFPVSWKWATCSPVVLRATAQPPHTLLRKTDKKWSGLTCFHVASIEKWKRQMLSQKRVKMQVINTVNHFLCEEATGPFCSLPFYFKFDSTSFHLSCYHCSNPADAMTWLGQWDTHFTKQTALLPHPASIHAWHRVLETRNDGKSDLTWQRREILY